LRYPGACSKKEEKKGKKDKHKREKSFKSRMPTYYAIDQQLWSHFLSRINVSDWLVFSLIALLYNIIVIGLLFLIA